jgi:hypothetical protein
VADKNGVLPYTGIAQAMGKIATEEGPSALMKGLLPRVFYLGPLASITMAVYEKVGKMILLRKGPKWCKQKKGKAAKK